MTNIFWMGFSLYDLFFYFTIYAFLGWCLEVSYAGIDTGKFINRGFLNGPVCPIYGFACIIVIMFLTPIENNLFVLFLGSVILTSILEFIAGFLLEKIFHEKWWDYSDIPFNIKGYICLKFSLAWGIACTFVIKLIHPMIQGLVHLLPTLVGYILIGIIFALFVADTIATIMSILKLQSKIKEINLISEQLRIASDKIGETISEEVLELRDKYNELSKNKTLYKSRLLSAFPDLRVKIDEKKKEINMKISKLKK